MSHQSPEFETKDVLGKTTHYNGTVGSPDSLVPSVIGDKISNVLVRNPSTNGINDILYVSFSGGTTYLSLKRGEFAAWSPKNNSSGTPITQVRVSGSTPTVAYEIIMDFEP